MDQQERLRQPAPDFKPAWVSKDGTRSGPAFPSGHVVLGPAWDEAYHYLNATSAVDGWVSLSDIFQHLKSMGHNFKLDTVINMLDGAGAADILDREKRQYRKFYRIAAAEDDQAEKTSPPFDPWAPRTG